MDDKNIYNDRFLLPDPLSYTACSRTTRYRIRKRLRLESGNTQDMPHDIQGEPSCTASESSAAQLELQTENFQQDDTDASRCEDSLIESHQIGYMSPNSPVLSEGMQYYGELEPDGSDESEFQELCDRCGFQEELEKDEEENIYEAEEIENLELSKDTTEVDCSAVSFVQWIKAIS